MQEINGVPTRVFAGRVPNEREAATIWQKKAEDLAGQDSKSVAERKKFIDEAVVDITLWVREEDGYIARFVMNKTFPRPSGTVRETVDYVYSDFGQVSPIAPPDTSKTSLPGWWLRQLAQPVFDMVDSYAFRPEVAQGVATRTMGPSEHYPFSGYSCALHFPQWKLLVLLEKRWLVPPPPIRA